MPFWIVQVYSLSEAEGQGTKRQQKGTKNDFVYFTIFFVFALMVDVMTASKSCLPQLEGLAITSVEGQERRKDNSWSIQV